MPVMQGEPLKEHHDEKETEAKNRRRKDKCKQVAGLHLIACIDDCIAQTAFPDARRAGKQFSSDSANDADSGRYADAREEIREGVRQSKLKQHLRGRSLVHEKKVNHVFVNTDQALRCVGNDGRQANNERDNGDGRCV